MLELKNVTKNYPTANGDFTALSNISFQFPNRGLVALYGENGCGKTTLLNLISTLDTQYDGEVLYNGQDIRNITKMYRRNVVSVVLQENSFVNYLNIRDNIQLFADKEEWTRIDENLLNYDIIEKQNESPLCVSGGQKQRVSIVRGLSKHAEILLVDEPTSSLNELMEKEVFESLQKQAKDKLVILVSHRIALIRQYADMVIYMDKGTIRSVEFMESSDIIYADNRIEIPETISSFAILDVAHVKQMIKKNKTITLSMGSGVKTQFVPDYSISPKKNVERNIELPRDLKGRIIRASLSKTKSFWISVSALITVLAVLLGLLCSLAYFDRYSFAFRSISGNVSGWINYRNSSVSSQTIGSFGLDTYEDMKNLLGTTILVRETYDICQCMDFPVSGIYSNEIVGIAYCRAEDVTIIKGQYADADSIMLTDYLADGLVYLNGKYDSVESVLSDGIELGNIHLDVCGIIDTDYEKYKDIYDSEEFSKTQRFIDYQQNQLIYKSIFLPMPSLDGEYILPFLTIQYGELFVSLEIVSPTDPDYEKLSNTSAGCFVSQSLHGCYADGDIVKYTTGCFNVVGTKNDSGDKPVLYITKEAYKDLLQALFETINDVSVDLKNADEEKMLEQCGMAHDTSMSGYINTCIEIISVLQEGFLFVLILLFLGMLICAFFLMNNMLSNDKHLIGFMRIDGYRTKAIFILEWIKNAILAIGVFLLAELGFLAATWGLNALLSRAFGYSIAIFDVNALSILVIFITVLASFAGALLRCVTYFRSEIVDLVK